ncbi:MAG: DNA polymerase, partial [Chromatiaceae bacterium]|nr:DNA polymerase [Candidatus Thioaporhodococcus sediminis]
GRRIQVQNFPRGSLTPLQVEDAIFNLQRPDYLDMMYGSPLDVISSCLRGMIVAAPGNELVAADFNAIEARVLAWLAGQESVLEIFRTHGKIYEHAAAGIYSKPMEEVTKAERQIGKVAVLALGYQGGVGAFQSMARIYGVKMADTEADKIKTAWRETHPRITHYWHDLESAAINAVELGCVCKAGAKDRQVAFKKDGSFLWCRLPSGRVLCYPYPTVKQVEVPWGGTKPALFYWCVNGTTNKWKETSTYGGSLAENVTQAVARDLLADAIVRLEHNQYPVVMHVHDEVVVEVPADAPADTVEKIETLISQTPAWAKGLPVSAEGWRGRRYRK